MLINIRLIFLCPPLIGISMEAGLRISSKFTGDERLVISDGPVGSIRGFRMSLVPPYILIDSDNIEGFSKGIVHYFCMPVGSHEQCRGNQPGGIERTRP